MATQEFWIDYFDKKYLDSQFPNIKNFPHFQLAHGDVGGTNMYAPDEEKNCNGYNVISNPLDFPALALDVLRYLKKPISLENSYEVTFSGNAHDQLGENGRRVLEEILALHKDFITPRRT